MNDKKAKIRWTGTNFEEISRFFKKAGMPKNLNGRFDELGIQGVRGWVQPLMMIRVSENGKITFGY